MSKKLCEAGLSGESDEQIATKIFSLISFLEGNGLSRKFGIESPSEITDEFAITSEDLNEEGMNVIRKSYEKWSSADTGSGDVRLLELTLKRVRNSPK
ncbi:MAG: hypothetical protein CMO55_14910 [Verrucomicrobiales bacterium]|nr:hypothetical protein [Verrucomicrobiales bacterium]